MKIKLYLRILPGVIDFAIIALIYKLLNQSILTLWEVNGYFLFTCCYFVYYLLSYLIFNTTPGHYAFSQVNEVRNRPFSIVLREAIKTIVFPGIPVVMIYFMQIRFNPFLYGIFIISCIVLLLINVFLKKHIWDLLAINNWKRERKKASFPVLLAMVSLMLVVLNVSLIARLDPLDAKPFSYPANRSVSPYTDWLEANKPMGAVDYVFSLFEKYDHVIISERTHSEYTQYEFLMEVISDSRFNQVRNIHFEALNAYYQDEMQDYAHTHFSDEDMQNEKTAEAMTYGTILWPWFGSVNLFDFLKKVNTLNTDLPDSLKLNIYCADIAGKWDTITGANVLEAALTRDEYIGQKIVQYIQETNQEKSLIILNSRHAFIEKQLAPDEFLHAAEYIYHAFGGAVANVLLNAISFNVLPMSSPIQSGKWDKAFELLEMNKVGFDFKDSPFGKDGFDFNPFVPGRYEDIYTGFVYWEYPENHLFLGKYPYREKFNDLYFERAKKLEGKLNSEHYIRMITNDDFPENPRGASYFYQYYFIGYIINIVLLLSFLFSVTIAFFTNRKIRR
ncbi:MAG: hypothetical protein EA361_14600 [Bacteroidetes bacterium]|nr:MAG: hypothetical protein EA361_14600 [Bacteroidota bacterium]